MLRENTGSKGDLDTDKISRALLAWRNTPSKDLGVSPAQILYGRALRDHLQIPKEFLEQRKEWVTLKADREKALSTRYGKIEEDLKRHSNELKELPVGAIVQVQNQKGKDPLKWDKSGVVVESLGNHQYTVKMDGSGRVTLRNRKILRKIRPLVNSYVSIDDVLDKQSSAKKVVIDEPMVEDPGHAASEQVVQVQGGADDEAEQRRSTRVKSSPNYYESKW